jgi:hypothetical protein
MSLHCSSCNSQDMQRLPLLYAAGTSRGSTSGTAVGGGFGGGTFGVGGARVSLEHFTQTDLAQRAAPPKEPGSLTAVGCGLGGLFYFTYLMFDVFYFQHYFRNVPGAILGWVLFIGLPILIFTRLPSRDAEARARWQQACATWDSSYMCLRCGHVMQL